MNYTTIAIIYNPNSTGPSRRLAKELKERITSQSPKQKIELMATKYAGHAEIIAYEVAMSSKNSLIISSSGDGGYNEVVNGVMKAMSEGARVTAGLLPAGNANDHHRNLHRENFVSHILKGESMHIDLLKITGVSNKKPLTRYAHSYIGFGLTPIIGKELNKTKLNPLNELLVVVRSFFAVKSIRLKIDQKVGKYESLILSNVDEMSKYLKISQPSSVTDGKFEVTVFKQQSKFKLITTLLKASTGNIKEDAQVRNFHLETVDKTSVQADGEILTLDAGSNVTITIDHQVLRSVI